MKCIFCNKTINNKGSLSKHQMCCKNNPHKTKFSRSVYAGAQKGSTPWNKGLVFEKKTHELIETGDYKNLSEPIIRKHVKRYLIESYGHQCNICHNTHWNNQPIPLICDHIDGDSTNSDLSNFRLVCCNCDAQLPTYKSKNRGKGRAYDRNRYHISKQYQEVARLVEDTHLK
jgi:hypothetical protein